MSKSKHFGLRLDPEDYDKLAAIAFAQDRPISWLVRKIVLDWLAAQERPKKRGTK